jgi:four helix bundle protein
MKTNNVMQEKAFSFALRIISLHKYLNNRNERTTSNQVLRSGTSIGANIEEAIGGLTRKEFLLKLTIAYKEARETMYWLKLLKETGSLEEQIALSLISDCDELIRLLGSAQKTMKAKITAN